MEFLEKELNIADTEVDPNDSYKSPRAASGTQTSGNSAKTEPGKGSNNVEDNLDDIEATLAQLKRELGL